LNGLPELKPLADQLEYSAQLLNIFLQTIHTTIGWFTSEETICGSAGIFYTAAQHLPTDHSYNH
jgi:hypothetical protein